MTNELAETTVQRDEWKRIAEDRGIELERLRADISQSRTAIEQLHAAVKTAQELAATRLMEIERLQKRLDRINEKWPHVTEVERLRDALKRVRRVAAEGTTHTGMIAALGILVDRTLNPGNGPLPPDYTYRSDEPCERHRWKPGMWNVYYVRSDGQERPALSAETAEGAANALRQDAADLVRVIESEGASRDASSEQPLTHFAGIPIIEDPTMPPDQIELRNDGNCPTGDWPHNFATETTERMTKGRCIYCGAPEKRT